MSDPSAPGATLRDFARNLSRRGHATAIQAYSGGRVEAISYAELSDVVMRLAAGLYRQGVTPLEPVIIFGPNSLDWVVVRLALAALGTVGVALDEFSSDSELAVLLPDSGARRAFVASGFLPRLRALEGGGALELMRLDAGGEEDPAPHWRELLADVPDTLPPIAPDDAVIQVYTSGTTGHPKSFFLSHSNLIYNIDSMVAR